MNSMVDAGHLGGYVPGGDEATFYPELWTWLIKDYGVKSVLDVGCGDGVALDYFRNLLGGHHVCGIEGVPQDHEYIQQHDYAEGRWPVWPVDIGWDLVWCCEFVEHVEEEYVNNFLYSFQQGKLVLMTHAFPGQLGHHHVNCQPAWYWVNKMREIGYTLDTDLTLETRQIAGKNTNPYNHYVRSGLAFRRINGNI